MLSNDAINAAIQRVEVDFPVEDWTINGVRIWPLVKADIASESFRAGRRVVGAASAPRLVDRYPLRPMLEVSRTNAKRVRASVLDRQQNQKLVPAHALLYSDGASFVQLDGQFYERFCDPVRERLAAKGRSSLMVTPLREFHTPRHAPSYFVQPRLDRARLKARARNMLARGRAKTANLPRFEEALAVLGETLSAVGDRSRYERLITYLEEYEAVFGAILDRVRPKVVFIVCYYAIEPMALIRACHARGIISVDLQHGAINDSHYAYAGRHRFPASGFDLLPHAFWVWSEQEEATIRAWAADAPGAPKTVLGGNPFLETWRDESLPFVRDATMRVNAIQAEAPGLSHVMYTTQGYETEAELARLADAIRQSSDRLFWWVRLHPANPGARPVVESALARSGTTNYVVQSHTEIPLYGVLRFMDAHVTHSSSTVIEAAAFRVPSVILSRKESVMYAHQITTKWAVVIDDDDSLVDAVLRQAAAREGLSSDTANAPSADGALEEILNLR